MEPAVYAGPPDAPLNQPRRYWLHLLLFVVTLLTTTLAGAEMVTNGTWIHWEGSESSHWLGWADLLKGLPYSLSFVAFLTFHEFGHYFTALYHKVRCSLPYYIPIFFPFFIFNIGSFGAVIRLRRQPESRRKYFDIGVAGPLAGFVVSILLLWIGFTHLPSLDYLYEMNPYAQQYGHVPTEDELLRDAPAGGILRIGDSLLFNFFERVVADPSRLPNHFELVHYPLLFAGFITLFFTALNLLPIGQLDGGHVMYGLFGRRRAGIISRLAVVLLLTYGGLGFIRQNDPFWAWGLYLLYLTFICSFLTERQAAPTVALVIVVLGVQQGLQWLLPQLQGNLTWLIYALLAVRVVRLDHPPSHQELPLNPRRKLLGWLAVLIFILSFSPNPLSLVTRAADAPTSNELYTHHNLRPLPN